MALKQLLGSSGKSSETREKTSPARLRRAASIVVFAAASLKKRTATSANGQNRQRRAHRWSFRSRDHPDLVTQLTQGAAADVFASADTNNMEKAAQAGLRAGAPVNFASNTLTIAVAPGNPKNIASFQDLTRPGLNVVITDGPCAVWIGHPGRSEQATGVQLAPVSEETSVTDVLNKVTTGQADAGIVYVTDALGAGTESLQFRLPKPPTQ